MRKILLVRQGHRNDKGPLILAKEPPRHLHGHGRPQVDILEVIGVLVREAVAPGDLSEHLAYFFGVVQHTIRDLGGQTICNGRLANTECSVNHHDFQWSIHSLHCRYLSKTLDRNLSTHCRKVPLVQNSESCSVAPSRRGASTFSRTRRSAGISRTKGETRGSKRWP